MVAKFVGSGKIEKIVIILRTCKLPAVLSHTGPTHRAKALIFSEDPWDDGANADDSNDCREHHVIGWPGWMKVFGDAARTARLSLICSCTVP